jgi:hypothetical protein
LINLAIELCLFDLLIALFSFNSLLLLFCLRDSWDHSVDKSERYEGTKKFDPG